MLSTGMSTDETTVHRYEQQLSEATKDSFISLRQITATSADKVVNIYGIINSCDPLTKKVSIIDPTLTSGLTFVINDIITDIVIKNIIRLTNISIVKTSEETVLKVNESKDWEQIYSFSYDYESDNPCNSNVFYSQSDTPFGSDKPVAKLLEEWFANTFLQYNSFDKLSVPTGAQQFSDSYIDFACLVIGSQLMKNSIQLTVYDGSEPSIPVLNQYLQHREEPTNQYYRLNTDLILPKRLDTRRLMFVNVWTDVSNLNHNNYDISKATSLINGDDLIVIFNVELSKAMVGQVFTLNLWSGRHFGQCIRRVHRKSVFGKQLMEKIKSNELSTDLQKCLSDHYYEHELGHLQQLGTRRLEALHWQQISENVLPIVYRNEYKYDLKSIENALQKCRQLSHFPKTPFTALIPPMRTIASIGSLADELVLVRAKVVECSPKSVFPINRFIILKCSSCQWIQTLKTYETIASVKFTADKRHLDLCPECLKSEVNSQLTKFYSFVFTIEDSNRDKTSVCLQKHNAFNVFGIDAQQVLNEPNAAINLDNILMQILYTSDLQQSIDFIIKRQNSSAFQPQNADYEVISLAPKSF